MRYPHNVLTGFIFMILFLGLKEDHKDLFINTAGSDIHIQQIPDTSLVDSFYILNRNRYIWINKKQRLDKDGITLLRIIKNARYYGLEPDYYHYSKLNNLFDQLNSHSKKKQRRIFADSIEKMLTQSYFNLGKDLNYGRIDSVEQFTKLQRKSFKIDLLQYLQYAVRNDSLIEYLLDLQPKHIEYHKLQKALSAFLDRTEITEEKIWVDPYNKDSLSLYKQARKALVIHQYIKEESISDSLFMEALKRFQYDHGLSKDGIIGKYTAKALSKSPFEFYQDAAASMERWRWKTPWEKDFLYVNIPAFQLKYYLNDSLQQIHRVVVGKRSRKTPEVYSKLNYIVAYPYWHVPRSISVGEILVKAKNDPSYITRNNYEIFTSGLKKISPDQVKWDTVNRSNFNFYIRQGGGYTNALGIVKFIFKNKYSIYLHDTPTKRYFKKDIRAYSHGCVRVQDALGLAGRVLQFDDNEYNKDSINAYVKRKIEKEMILIKDISVYIQYITCDTDLQGNLIFYNDVYNRDKKLKDLLFNAGF